MHSHRKYKHKACTVGCARAHISLTSQDGLLVLLGVKLLSLAQPEVGALNNCYMSLLAHFVMQILIAQTLKSRLSRTKGQDIGFKSWLSQSPLCTNYCVCFVQG